MSSDAQEDGFDFPTILPSLLIHRRVEDVFGGDASVSDTLVVAHHPDVDIRNAVLRLC